MTADPANRSQKPDLLTLLCGKRAAGGNYISGSRVMRFLVLLAIIFVLVSQVSGEPPKDPVQPPSKMTMTLPKQLSKRGDIPIILSFLNESGEVQRFMSFSFVFVLLDEDGAQVSTDPFIFEAVIREVVLEGRKPSYKPRLAFDTYCKELQVGKHYQLICVLPTSSVSALAGSARFTLIE